MIGMQRTVSPIDGSVVVERPLASPQEIDNMLDQAVSAQKAWSKTRLQERAAICEKFAEHLGHHQLDLAAAITQQIGRPISQTPGEVKGCIDRARTMIALASSALADIEPEPIDGFRRFIRRTPMGVVYVIAPWNYPLLTAVNTVVPAILAGNSVVLKPAPQTPLSGEHFLHAFEAAGLPKGVLQVVVASNSDAERIVADRRVNHVAFTGSVRTGRLVQRAASDRFISVGLELGGKDPAYVRPDADISFSAGNIIDGAFFNSGQSCCAVERIYVHTDVYDEFVEQAVKLTCDYHLGNPLEPSTNLGPVVTKTAAAFIRGQVEEALAGGARSLAPVSAYELARPDGTYVSPRLLVDVDHRMRVMTEETFGPVVGIMRVSSDQEAIALMNDSQYGLTASLWTRDLAAAETLAADIETGTVFLNRCDYLDPSLAWTGVKDSGRGASLSVLGYEHLTQPKSFHFRLPG